ncbi:MAG: hypothetical protein ABI579_05360, partial [Candidatus Sumerlaeota bacterium]
NKTPPPTATADNNKAASNQIGPVVYATLGEYIIESRTGGKNFADYSEISGDWQNSTSKSTAAGTTQGIGSRFATMATKDDVVRFAPSGTEAGTNIYDVFYTSNNVASTNAPAATWRVNTESGIVSGTFDALGASTGNSWFKLGQFTFTTGTGYVELDSSTVTTSGNNDRLPADALRFVYVGPAGTPSPSPTSSPVPTDTPSPTVSLTPIPSLTPSPSISPSVAPTISPSLTVSPTVSLTVSPTPSLTISASLTPSLRLTPEPSLTPSLTPSPLPSPEPKEAFILSSAR